VNSDRARFTVEIARVERQGFPQVQATTTVQQRCLPIMSERREADQRRREQIRALPVEQ